MRVPDLSSSIVTAPVVPAAPVAGGNPGASTKVADRGAEQQDGRKVAEQFTAIFANILVKEMWNSSSSDGEGPFGNGPGADIYRGIAEGALSESLARSGLDALVDRVEEMIETTRRRTAAADAELAPDAPLASRAATTGRATEEGA